MPKTSEQHVPSILNKTGLDVFLEELRGDINEIKDTLKEIPTNERIAAIEQRFNERLGGIETRVDKLEQNQVWFVRLVVGFVVLAILGLVVASGRVQF